MAHEIDMSNNKANMAYVGEKPWHGLGSEVDPSASIKDWVDAAGLNWSVERAPVQYQNGKIHTIDDRHVLYRSDTGAHLGIVSNKYQIVQPYEVLEFFRDLVSNSDMAIETAGSLWGGARIWALAKIQNEAVIKGTDRIGGYLLLSTSFDGGLATNAQFTSVRVVCQNTLRMADNENKYAKIRIPHSTKFNANQVKAALGIATERFEHFVNDAEKLANKMISDSAADDFLKILLGNNSDAPDITKTKAYKSISNLYFGKAAMGSDMESADGTRWGLLNAVTQYIDHEKNSRTPDSKLDSAWFGDGATFKDTAFQSLLAMK
jgi:phage/plasmid-like protein (TIGR03299 family)